MRRIAIAGILALCASCASAFQMKLPSQGRNWFEVKSDHFDLVTDLDEKAGAQLAGDASWAACRPDYVGDKGHHQLERQMHDFFLQDEVHIRAFVAPSARYTGEPSVQPLGEAPVRTLRASLLLHGPHPVDDLVVAQARADVN